MPTLADAMNVICKIFSDSSVTLPTVTPSILLLILFSLIIVAIKDLTDEFMPRHCQLLTHKNTILRWGIYVVLLCVILACGVFDASQFIYVSF